MVDNHEIKAVTLDFDGTTLQGAGKAGQFISEDNKKALVKVTATITGA